MLEYMLKLKELLDLEVPEFDYYIFSKVFTIFIMIWLIFIHILILNKYYTFKLTLNRPSIRQFAVLVIDPTISLYYSLIQREFKCIDLIYLSYSSVYSEYLTSVLEYSVLIELCYKKKLESANIPKLERNLKFLINDAKLKLHECEVKTNKYIALFDSKEDADDFIKQNPYSWISGKITKFIQAPDPQDLILENQKEKTPETKCFPVISVLLQVLFVFYSISRIILYMDLLYLLASGHSQVIDFFLSFINSFVFLLYWFGIRLVIEYTTK